MNRQEIFNKAYKGLRAQGFKRSVSDDGNRCLYRAPNGRKCAIGHCISDADYDRKFEGRSVNSSSILKVLGAGKANQTFLIKLQRIHDNDYSSEVMKQKLQVFAKSYNLTIPE